MLTTFFQAAVGLSEATVDFTKYAKEVELPGAENSMGELIANLLGGVMAIATLMVLLYLVWGAFSWITSGGDAAKITKARDKMTQAVIGIIVLAASVAIFALVQSFLGVELLNFTNQSIKPSGKAGSSYSPPKAKTNQNTNQDTGTKIPYN